MAQPDSFAEDSFQADSFEPEEKAGIPEQLFRGFISNPLSSALGTASTVLAATPGIAQIYQYKTGRDPYQEALDAAAGPQIEQFKKAKEEFDKGSYINAARRGLAGIVPIVGPFIENTAEKATTQGKPWEAAADVAAALLYPKLIEKTSKLPGTVRDYVSEHNTKAAGGPVPQLEKAIRPRSINYNFKQKLEEGAMDEIHRAQQQLGHEIGQGPEQYPGHAIEDMLEATKIAKKDLWSKIESMMGPARQRGSQIDSSALAQAANRAIGPDLRRENPNLVRKMEDRNNAAYAKQKLTVPELEELLQTWNAKLSSTYYQKYPGQNWELLKSDPETAQTFAKATEARKLLSDFFEKDTGAGEAFKDAKRRYGGILNTEQELWRRRNPAVRGQVNDLSQRLSKIATAGDLAMGIVTGHPIVGAAAAAGRIAVANWLRDLGSSDTMIRDAFKNYKPIKPPIEVPPPPLVKGLLESGAIRMPGAPDTSGPIPPTLPKGLRIRNEGIPPERQLPGASPGQKAPLITPPPADVSGPIPSAERTPVPPVGRWVDFAEGKRQITGIRYVNGVPHIDYGPLIPK